MQFCYWQYVNVQKTIRAKNKAKKKLQNQIGGKMKVILFLEILNLKQTFHIAVILFCVWKCKTEVMFFLVVTWYEDDVKEYLQLLNFYFFLVPPVCTIIRVMATIKMLIWSL